MKITLAAIIGNEESVIERFLRSFAPAVDSFVLVSAIGTQDPDGTMVIAKSVCRELGKHLEISHFQNDEFPHVSSFGEARQHAWRMAQSFEQPDFLLWADADDVLADGAAEAIRAAAEDGQHDVYLMPYHVRGDKQIVTRERMVKASIGSHWQYAIHEQLAFPQDVTYRIIKDAVFLHQPLAEKTSGHSRNVAILSKELDHVPRNLFYLAQEYFQHGMDREFQQVATSALTFHTIGTIERYELLLQLAQTPGNDSRKLAAEAFSLMPDRREALALLTSYCLMDGDNAKALEFASKMIETEKPKRTYWSQNNEWYGWKGEELFLQCLRLNGKNDEADDFDAMRQDWDRPKFSIIHATLGRPEQALAVREMWLSLANHPENVEYIFGLHSFDEKSAKYLKGYRHTVTDSKGAAVNYDTAAGISTGDIIIQAQDDCYPPQGWDDALANIIGNPEKPVFVATNDGHRTDLLTVNSIMTRAYMDIKAARDPGEAGFFHRGYVTVFPDTENSYRALQDAKAGICEHIHAPQFTIFHNHPHFVPGLPWDATYEWENHPENYHSGFRLFAERNPDADPDCFQLKREGELVTA